MKMVREQLVQAHRRVPDSDTGSRGGLVDMHCHCLPGLDDGPATTAQAVQLCAESRKDGVETVMATVHQLGRYDLSVTAAMIRRAVGELRWALAEAGVPLRVVAGADVRIDERLGQLIDDDLIMTLADGGKYVLVEFPRDVCVDVLPLVEDLKARGITPVLSHPERHGYLGNQTAIMLSWMRAGMVFQVTAGSLLGRFGIAAEREAWGLLEAGWVSLVASDAHDCVRRRPMLGIARERIAERCGAWVAERVCGENPRRILEGRPLAVVGR